MIAQTTKRFLTITALTLSACILTLFRQIPAQAQSPTQARDYDHSLYVLRGSGPFGRNHPLPFVLPTMKSPFSMVEKPNIPLSVIRDIQRVRPGMTRGDLDWLFVPDGGVMIGEHQAPYIYRYGGVTVTPVDSDGRPIIDKITHKPLLIGEAIKIDVRFKPAPANARGIARLHPPIYPNGKSDDIIISVSEPYCAFPNDN